MSSCQASFTEEHKFASCCSHCGKPMGSMSIQRYERDGFDMKGMDVYKVWIDPQHECDYLQIAPKEKP